MTARSFDRDLLPRAVGFVAVSTFAVTAAFVGILAVIEGDVERFATRLPYYLLVTAVLFTSFVFLFESRGLPGRLVLWSSVGVAVGGFLLFALGGEGLIFLVRHPEAVLASQLIVYLLAAGVVCTGVGYWTLRYWREFAQAPA